MSVDASLAPLALWLTPLLLTIIGALVCLLLRYFLAHISASMARIEARIAEVCRDMRDNYVTRRECDAHRAGLKRDD